MPAPPSLERLKDDTARRLKRYVVMPTHSAFMLWRLDDEWKPIRPFDARDQAEEYLFGKLPPIKGEL